MDLLLGIDLGTSYFKLGLFDVAGNLKGLGRVAVPRTMPAPGRCELGVDEFWGVLRSGLAAAFTEAGANARDIIGLSYSSQASTFLLLDERDRPLTPLIVWLDTRGEPVEPGIAAFARTEAFRSTIGFEGLSGQSAATKWRWWQREEPERWRRARRIMTISDYFTFALTGERLGDASTAAFLASHDLKTGEPWKAAINAYGIEATQLSTLRRPGAACGRTLERATELIELPANIPFAVGALDHHVAAIGSGLERLADLSISTGTVLAALALVDAATPQAGCYHGRHVDGARFWRLAFDPNGAGQLEDYQRSAAPRHSIEELIALAAQAPVGVAWHGDRQNHGEAVRAILERVAAAHRDLVRTVVRGGAEPRRIVATGGGARSAVWLQIEADMLGVPVVTPACSERACLGAAAFAAVAAGRYASIPEAISAMVRPEKMFEPVAARTARYRELAGRGR